MHLRFCLRTHRRLFSKTFCISLCLLAFAACSNRSNNEKSLGTWTAPSLPAASQPPQPAPVIHKVKYDLSETKIGRILQTHLDAVIAMRTTSDFSLHSCYDQALLARQFIAEILPQMRKVEAEPLMPVYFDEVNNYLRQNPGALQTVKTYVHPARNCLLVDNETGYDRALADQRLSHLVTYLQKLRDAALYGYIEYRPPADKPNTTLLRFARDLLRQADFIEHLVTRFDGSYRFDSNGETWLFGRMLAAMAYTRESALAELPETGSDELHRYFENNLQKLVTKIDNLKRASYRFDARTYLAFAANGRQLYRQARSLAETVFLVQQGHLQRVQPTQRVAMLSDTPAGCSRAVEQINTLIRQNDKLEEYVNRLSEKHAREGDAKVRLVLDHVRAELNFHYDNLLARFTDTTAPPLSQKSWVKIQRRLFHDRMVREFGAGLPVDSGAAEVDELYRQTILVRKLMRQVIGQYAEICRLGVVDAKPRHSKPGYSGILEYWNS